MGGRGVAPVLGLALLLGFVIAGALAVFAVGVTVVDSSQERTETAHAEQSMLAAAESADALATGDRQTADFSFEGAGDGVTDVDETAGRLNITQYVDGEVETVILDDAELGAFRFERDNTEFAYQAGAVWRLDNVGDPVLIRAPELHYTGQTLTFPFVTVTGDATDGQQTGVMRVSETQSVYPDAPTDFNPLRNGTVMLEVESRYCTGWEEYFVQQTEGALIEGCGETGETIDDELLVELVVPFEFEETENAVLTENTDYHKNAEVNQSEERAILNVPGADGLIDRIQDECDGTYDDELDNPVTDEGVHCVDEIDDDLIFDTGADEADIEVYVNGDVEYDDGEQLEILGDGTVSLFVGGDVDLRGQSDVNCDYDNSDEECEATPSQLRVFVESGGTFGSEEQGSPSAIGAFVYVPEGDVEFQGSVHFEGSIIAKNATAGSASVRIEPHESTGDMELEYGFGGRSVYFLHITRTEIEFTGEP